MEYASFHRLIEEGDHEDQTPDMVEAAELYRELGLFKQARGLWPALRMAVLAYP